MLHTKFLKAFAIFAGVFCVLTACSSESIDGDEPLPQQMKFEVSGAEQSDEMTYSLPADGGTISISPKMEAGKYWITYYADGVYLDAMPLDNRKYLDDLNKSKMKPDFAKVSYVYGDETLDDLPETLENLPLQIVVSVDKNDSGKSRAIKISASQHINRCLSFMDLHIVQDAAAR